MSIAVHVVIAFNPISVLYGTACGHATAITSRKTQPDLTHWRSFRISEFFFSFLLSTYTRTRILFSICDDDETYGLISSFHYGIIRFYCCGGGGGGLSKRVSIHNDFTRAVYNVHAHHYARHTVVCVIPLVRGQFAYWHTCVISLCTAFCFSDDIHTHSWSYRSYYEKYIVVVHVSSRCRPRVSVFAYIHKQSTTYSI